MLHCKPYTVYVIMVLNYLNITYSAVFTNVVIIIRLNLILLSYICKYAYLQVDIAKRCWNSIKHLTFSVYPFCMTKSYLYVQKQQQLEYGPKCVDHLNSLRLVLFLPSLTLHQEILHMYLLIIQYRYSIIRRKHIMIQIQ